MIEIVLSKQKNTDLGLIILGDSFCQPMTRNKNQGNFRLSRILSGCPLVVFGKLEDCLKLVRTLALAARGWNR